MGFDWVVDRDEVLAVDVREPRPGTAAEWPTWLPEETRARMIDAGIVSPWVHQARAAEELWRGRHTMLTTATGSGKTLGYLLPIIATTAHGILGVKVHSARALLTRRHTALYIAPAKALAHDQARAARDLGPQDWPVAAVDGDSTYEERCFAREHASLVLTNPDMLHHSILPGHQKWASFLGALRYIVVDEAHRYQGVFGAHVAQVIRRLRRLAEHHGANPTVALSSATLPNASAFARALAGVASTSVIQDDASPAGRRTVVLWRPAGSLRHDTAYLLSRLSDDGRQSIAFVTSRQDAELISTAAQKLSANPSQIASYRGGYLAVDRRELERDLQTGELRALASTNALELGVDIAGMDAVLVAGYPGKLASFWQQAGRAGRRGQDALVVLLARENPLDAHLLEHPNLVFSERVEPAVLHPDNPRVLGPHLAVAAQEIPLTDADEKWFGPTTGDVAAELVSQAVLRDRAGRKFWTRPERAAGFINLRTAGNRPFDIIEHDTGRVIGVVDEAAADRTVHEGAVYLHQGETFLVKDFDRAQRQALVARAQPRYYTQAHTSFEVQIMRQRSTRQLGPARMSWGEVRLDSQVTGYLRRDATTHDIWDSTPLDLPRHRMRTQAVWWSVPSEIIQRLGWPEPAVGAAAHAAEHTAIGLLPAFAPCDRWDIGGLSTALHPDTGLATVFVYDGMAGGAGFARRGFEMAEQWWTATLGRLRRCPCDDGCPSCVISPKCGNANRALDKAGAMELLELLIG